VVIFNAVWLLKWQSSAQAVPAVAAQDRLPAPPIEETS